MDSERLDAEIDANYDFFRRHLFEYLADNENRFALLRSQRVVKFYDEVADADREARAAFPDGIFSIQKVVQAPIDLGFFSHAGR